VKEGRRGEARKGWRGKGSNTKVAVTLIEEGNPRKRKKGLRGGLWRGEDVRKCVTENGEEKSVHQADVGKGRAGGKKLR